MADPRARKEREKKAKVIITFGGHTHEAETASIVIRAKKGEKTGKKDDPLVRLSLSFYVYVIFLR